MKPWMKYAMLTGLAGVGIVVALSLSRAGQPAVQAVGSTDTADPGMASARREQYATVFGRQSPGDIPAFVTGLENLPASLQGTEVDGALETDANGRLKVGNPVRRVFDYFLTAVGEEPLDTVLARLRAYIAHSLPPGAAAEAAKMLDDYLAYKEALVGIQGVTQPAGGRLDEAAVRSALQQARALRRDYMPAEMADAFYADEDAMNDYMLDRVVILQEERLTASQRASLLAEREARLPPALRESTHVVNQYRDLQSLTDQWKRQSGSPAELRQIRENLLGAEATDRLEQLDRSRADWNARVDAWMTERARIREAKGLDEADRARQIDALRRTHFSEEEQLRVETLERIAGQEGGLAARNPPGQ